MEDAMSNTKAAALIGLGFAVTGVCAANAATISQTDTFLYSWAPPAVPMPDFLLFAPFDPSLGTLTGVGLSLSSTLSVSRGPSSFEADVNAPGGGHGIVGSSTSAGSFDFSNVTALQDGLTLADFTGSGDFPVALTLIPQSFDSASITWNGTPPPPPPPPPLFNMTCGTDSEDNFSCPGASHAAAAPGGTGLTLTYDYTPVASLSQTPLPAALPLFASGLGALGLLGWRRKRKASASMLGAA